MLAPFVSVSVLAAMMVPGFWALVCFGTAGLVSGTVLGVATKGPLVMSQAQQRVRSAVVLGALATPVAVAAAVAYGLAPNMLEIFPEVEGHRIDWRTKRSRFREV